MSTHLLLIDPQNDFCLMKNSETGKKSALGVPGADKDMQRLAQFINAASHKIDAIHVTLDSHKLLDIAHPAWWIDKKGRLPEPFTVISLDDINTGIWQPRESSYLERTKIYAEALEARGKYQITIWPAHCLIGTWGHNIHSAVNLALQDWSLNQCRLINYIIKGMNPWTEHYGALMAEIPDPADPSTQLNTDLLKRIRAADRIFIAGEALSHCMKETILQIADNVSESTLKNIYILTDCTSSIPEIPGVINFPKIAQSFLQNMKKRGMKLITSEKAQKALIDE